MKQELKPASVSQCVDLLSSVSSEPDRRFGMMDLAQSLLLNWLVELDYTIGLDELGGAVPDYGYNQARVLEVLCDAVHSAGRLLDKHV